MRKILILAAITAIAGLAATGIVFAQQADAKFAITRAHLATWAAFSDAVVVSGPARTIYLSGVGSEDENGPRGNIRTPGNPYAQCMYAMDKIKRILAAQGADLNNVVKMTIYSTSMHARDDLRKCRAETYKGFPDPASTFVAINDLALPGMMIEIDITAAVPAR